MGSYRVPENQEGFEPLLFQHEYFTESVIDYGKNKVGWITVVVEDAERASEVASAIDKLFENSGDATRTATEDEYNRQFAANFASTSGSTVSSSNTSK